MEKMGRWGERDRDFIRLEDLDGGPGVPAVDRGFYAIWSRSRRRLMVTITPVERGILAQMSLRPPQASEVGAFLAETDPADPLRPTLALEDSDDPNDPRALRCRWWTGGTRLIVSMTSGLSGEPVGQVDLRPEQVAKLQRFLASTAQPTRPD